MKELLFNIIRRIIGIMCFVIYRVLYMFKRDCVIDYFTYNLYHYLPFYSINQYLKIKKTNEKLTIKRINEKKKIKVGFVVYTSSMWFLDGLYQRLNESTKYNAAIIIGHLRISKESSEEEYKNTNEFFLKKKYCTVDAKKSNEFDILFFLTPYEFYEEKLNIQRIALNQLIYHVSYSYMLADNPDKLLLNMYHWSYRYYTDTKFYYEAVSSVKQYSGNARFLGFPKMDSFYYASDKRISDKKTIIYAPHHSVTYKELKAATFEENYKFFLKLVKKYSDKVIWIYKPHPLLKDRAVQAHIFKDISEYDEYVDEWKKTNCAIIADSGDYFDYFKASDAMITDSVSFLAEYQFTGKPLLLLMSGMENYNEFGNSIVKVLYRCKGNDFDSINKFVEDVIDEKDSMIDIRREFFEEQLNYKKKMTDTANGKIYQDFIESLLPGKA